MDTKKCHYSGCGKDFEPTRPKQVFCCDQCRAYGHREAAGNPVGSGGRGRPKGAKNKPKNGSGPVTVPFAGMPATHVPLPSLDGTERRIDRTTSGLITTFNGSIPEETERQAISKQIADLERERDNPPKGYSEPGKKCWKVDRQKLINALRDQLKINNHGNQ